MKHIITFLLILFCASPLWGQGTYSDFERGLQLSEQQKMKMEQMRRRYMHDMRNLQQQSINRRIELHELNRNTPQNRDRIQKLRRELENLEMSRENTFNQYRRDVGKNLNSRQKEQYDRLVDTENRRNMRNRFKQRGYDR